MVHTEQAIYMAALNASITISLQPNRVTSLTNQAFYILRCEGDTTTISFLSSVLQQGFVFPVVYIKFTSPSTEDTPTSKNYATHPSNLTLRHTI
jgi:hypothetical protein